ncbi:MAG: class I poly(R)-hydroxyalkanoic acid synthase, partial [Alphaproteobacteria bacterium]
MADDSHASEQMPDPAELTATIGKIAEQSQRIVTDFMSRQSEPETDPLNIGSAFIEMTTRMMSDPARLAQAQVELWNSYMDLWQQTTNRMVGQNSEPLFEPEPDDRRFKDAAWQENPLFDYIKQSYLLTSKWMINTVRETDGLEDETARKVDFYTRQFVDAMAPTNFAMTNPEVLRETIDSKGQNLVKGLSNLLDDLEKGKGKLHIRHVED